MMGGTCEVVVGDLAWSTENCPQPVAYDVDLAPFDYRHVPLTGREAAIYDHALRLGLEANR